MVHDNLFIGFEVDMSNAFNAAIFVNQGKLVTKVYRREVSRMTNFPL
ncbi:unnamed protein product [Prunus brigantina]